MPHPGAGQHTRSAEFDQQDKKQPDDHEDQNLRYTRTPDSEALGSLRCEPGYGREEKVPNREDGADPTLRDGPKATTILAALRWYEKEGAKTKTGHQYRRCHKSSHWVGSNGRRHGRFCEREAK